MKQERKLSEMLAAAMAATTPEPGPVPRPVLEAVPEPDPSEVPEPAPEPAVSTDVDTVRRQRVRSARLADGLDRKDVFMWPDARDELDAIARRLERARPTGVGERITANTIIRVLIDHALDTGIVSRLTGHTEEALYAALNTEQFPPEGDMATGPDPQ